MMKEKAQQFLRLLQEHHSVLIALPQQPSTDAIATGLAMLRIVEKLGRKGIVASSGFRIPTHHAFLPNIKTITPEVNGLRKFIITVNVEKTPLDELSYNIEGTELHIYIVPKHGSFAEKDVKTAPGPYLFDLVIVIDSPSLDALGQLFEMNTEFFYQTPTITIDHLPVAEPFGQVNAVNVTATSTAEVLYECIREMNEQWIDEPTATLLLAGMISKTRSFQAGSVTPRSLSIASQLISRGARREEIVKHLYQSKQLSTLRLWGRILSQLQSDAEHRIVWSRLSQTDFTDTQATERDLPEVIDELILNTPEANHAFILYSLQNNIVKGVIHSAPYVNARELFTDLSPRGSDHHITIVSATQTPEQLEAVIRERLKKSQQKSV